MCCFQETGLYEYKVFGALTTCSPGLCADVYMDLTYRKDWDKYAKGKKPNQKQTHKVTLLLFLPSKSTFPHSPCLRTRLHIHITVLFSSTLLLLNK